MSEIVRSIQFESTFKGWNLPFELIEAVAIDSITRDDSTQVRELGNRAIPANVEQYALQMKNGTEFPPVVVWAEQNWLLDGNTRLSAAQRIGRTTFPVYRVKIPFLAMAKALTATLQELSGQKLTPTERRQAALNMMELEFTDAAIAAALGVTAESARQWRRRQEVAERADRTGTAAQVAKMGKTNQLSLAKITHDDPFRDLVLAIADGKPDVASVRTVSDEVAAATSDEAARAIIADARASWTPIGPDPKQVRVNRKARQARMHLGGLLALTPADVVDRAKLVEDQVKWERVLLLAQEVLQLIFNAENTSAA